MPVFDFSNPESTTTTTEATYTTFHSDKNVATPEDPILLLDNATRQWAHHSCGVFTNPAKHTAFEFEEEVFYHFTEYIMKQESERLMWGKGRILHHENLYELVERLKNKEIDKDSLELEQRQLEEVWERQCAYYKDDIEYLIRAVTKFSEMLQETVVLFEKN